MAWTETVITNSGMSLYNEALHENGLDIVRATGGFSTYPTASLMTQMRVTAPEMNLPIAGIRSTAKGREVIIRVNNIGLESLYILKQVGLYARKTGETGNDTFIAIIQDSRGIEIPAESTNPEFVLEFGFLLPLSNECVIHAEIDPSVLVTREELEEAIVRIESSIESSLTAETTARLAGDAALKLSIDEARGIAEGRARAKVFSDTAEMQAWLKVIANAATLNIGDNLYIIARSEPDYWWDGAKPQPLETEKVDLTDYYTRAQIDLLLVSKVDVTAFNAALAGKVNQADVPNLSVDYANSAGYAASAGSAVDQTARDLANSKQDNMQRFFSIPPGGSVTYGSLGFPAFPDFPTGSGMRSALLVAHINSDQLQAAATYLLWTWHGVSSLTLLAGDNRTPIATLYSDFLINTRPVSDTWGTLRCRLTIL
ncbi:MAG: hypothetical protein FWE74_05755 [Oscillospiraceae bacterium]|nr:hypothetical protein [Oscillospiraceae bacterium]